MLLGAPARALVVEGEPQSPAALLQAKQGDDEVHPQRYPYERERRADGYVEGGEGKKRGGGETES